MSETGWVFFQPAVDRPTLDALLGQMFPKSAFWLGTSPLRAELGRANDRAALTALPDDWPAARVFTPAAEVRWERAPAGLGYRVWLLTEDPTLRPAVWSADRPAEQWRVGPAAPAIRLWGQYKETKEGGSWIEVRIPRRLDYPVPAANRRQDEFATLRHLEYRASNGAVQWTRLLEVL
jgi:hypothetical protein